MQFIDVDLSLALAHHAILMINSLWEVARARYIGAKLDYLRFDWATVGDTFRAHNESKSPYQPIGMHEQLLYYREADDPDE